MTQDEIFIECHKKAVGEEKAKKMLSDAKKLFQDQKKPVNVYLNVYGNEVHVNGDVSASLTKGETLIEKIKRFNRLEETVMAIRFARMTGMLPPLDDDEEEDVNDFSKLDDVENRDDFGDTLPNHSVAEPAKAGKANGAAVDAADGADGVAGDEPAADGEPGSPAMPSNE